MPDHGASPVERRIRLSAEVFPTSGVMKRDPCDYFGPLFIGNVFLMTSLAWRTTGAVKSTVNTISSFLRRRKERGSS